MSGLNDLLPGEIRYPQEMKCPVCLILDISGSMGSMDGEPIKVLNEGLTIFKKALSDDGQAKKTVDLCIVTFGGSVTTYPFCTVEDFNPPIYTANGETPMGKAILEGLALIEKRKEQYQTQGIHKFRPWVVIMTDGAPTDMGVGDPLWAAVTNKITQGEKEKHFFAWAFGIPGANFEILNKLYAHQELNNRRVYNLKGFDFTGLFRWLSDSLGTVSRSKEGDKIQIEAPPAKKETIDLEV